MDDDRFGMGEPGAAEPASPPSKDRDDTFFLPPDFPGADKLKAGDTITLKVISKGEDGDIEVEHTGMEEGEPDWKSDLRQSLAPQSQPETEEEPE